MVTSVMTPRVPSEPMKKLRKSGPVAWRGTGRVLTISPVGRTPSMATTLSSAFPYFVERVPEPLAAR